MTLSIKHHNANAIEFTVGSRTWYFCDGITIGGCGMDMGFELVYQLGYALWPNGTPAPHGTRNGEPDTNGGYALRQRWL
jgi:hypothetical protein